MKVDSKLHHNNTAGKKITCSDTNNHITCTTHTDKNTCYQAAYIQQYFI